MTAALKPLPPNRPPTLKVNRGTPREVTNELILDAARAIVLRGLKPTASLVAESVTHVSESSIYDYMRELRRRGLLPRAGSGLSCPTMARTGSHRMAGSDTCLPCSRCGEHGYHQPGKRFPERRNSEAWPGKVCRGCHRELSLAWRGKDEPVPVESSEGADELLSNYKQRIRRERGPVIVSMEAYDSRKSTLRDGLIEEQKVASEQAAKLVALLGQPSTPAAARSAWAREGSRRARREFREARGRLWGSGVEPVTTQERITV